MGITFGGCIRDLGNDLIALTDADLDVLWQMCVTYWFSMGWNGIDTI